MSRQNTSTIVRTAVAALLCLAAGACQHANTSQPAVSRIASIAALPATSPPHPQNTHTYRPTGNPCSVLDRAHLITALGPDAGDLTEPQSVDNPLATVARCDHRFGQVTSRSIVAVETTIVKIGSAQTFYAGVRNAEQQNTTITDVRNLGQGAYLYNDARTGPHLVMYDDNLYLTVAVMTSGGPEPATDIHLLLTQTARHAMTVLAGP